MNNIFKVIRDGVDAIVEVFGEPKKVSSSCNSICINGVKVEGIDDARTVTVKVSGNCGEIELESGNVEVKGNVEGDIDVDAGNVRCGKVSGKISVMCGNVSIV